MGVLYGYQERLGTPDDLMREPVAYPTSSEPGGAATFAALMRSESLLSGVTGLFNREARSSHEEQREAIAQGFSSIDWTDRALKENPYWGGDAEAELALRTSMTPREWAAKKADLDQLYHDRSVLANSGTGTVLMQSLAMGILDPVSLGFGVVTGGGVPIARAVAYSGAKHAYNQLGPLKRAHDAAKVRLNSQRLEASGQLREIQEQHKALRAKMNRAMKPTTKAKWRGQMDFLEGQMAQVGATFKYSKADYATNIQQIERLMGYWGNRTLAAPSPVVATAAGALTESALTEALLQEQQVGRTAQETMYNVLGSAAVSGLLSKGVGLYRTYVPKVLDPMIRRYEQERGINASRILGPEGDDSFNPPGRVEELIETGEASRPKWDAEREMLISEAEDNALKAKHGDGTAEYREAKWAKEKAYTGVKKSGLIKLVRILHPSARLATSDLVSHRLLGEALAQNDYVYNGVYEAGKVRQIAVETYVQHDIAQGTVATGEILDAGYLAVAKEVDSLRKNGVIKYLTGSNELSSRFKAEVWHDIIDQGYLREVGGNLTFRDPNNPLAGMEKHIRNTADELISKVLKPWEKRLIDAGLLSSDKIPVGHRAYLHRVWDKQVVHEHSAELKQIVHDSFYQKWENDVLQKAKENEADKVYSREELLARVKANAEDLDADMQKLFKDYEALEQDAAAFVQSIQGDQMSIAAVERLDPSAKKDASMASLLTRAPIASTRVKKFLVQDAGAVIQTWLRDVAPDYRLYEKFGPDYGTRLNSLVNQEAEERKTYLQERIAAETDARQKEAYQKELKRLIKDQEEGARAIEGIIATIRNRAGIPDNPDGFLNNAGKIARSFNFATKLGGMTISALTDLAYLVAKVGWLHAAPAIMKGIGGFGRLANEQRSLGSASFREFRSDARTTATVAELLLHNRMEAITMMEDIRGTGNLVDKSIHVLNTNFARMSLMNRWNDWVKSVSYMAYATKIKQHLDAGDMTRLAEFGIDPEMAGKISRAWQTHGDTSTGVLTPNMREWHLSGAEGIQAQDHMKHVLLNAVNSVVVTPGAGDIHMLMRHPMGKVLTQFQTFPVAVINRIILPTLQRTSFKDPTPIMNLGFAIPLGMMVYVLKEIAAGREYEDDWDTLVYEGVQRSGIFGVYATGFNVMDDGTGGALSKILFGEDFEAPHRSRNPFTDALGPTVRLGEDAVKAYGGLHNMLLNGESMAWGEGSAIRRLIPGNNLFYLRAMGELAGTGGPMQWQEAIMGQNAPD